MALILSACEQSVLWRDTTGTRNSTTGLAAIDADSAACGQATESGPEVDELIARGFYPLSGSNPFSGAVVDNLTPSFDRELGFDPSKRGVVVSHVKPGTPAEHLGLNPRDVVASIDGRNINTVNDVRIVFSESAFGSSWDIAIERDQRLLTMIAWSAEGDNR
jgi:S1-C subfamily serine protease